jgi:hypothetical protein
MISESIKDQPGLFSYMVSGSKPFRLRGYVAIWLVGLQWTGRGCIPQYGEWVYNGPARVVSCNMVGGSAMDWPGSYPAIRLVGLQWASQDHIQL